MAERNERALDDFNQRFFFFFFAFSLSPLSLPLHLPNDFLLFGVYCSLSTLSLQRSFSFFFFFSHCRNHPPIMAQRIARSFRKLPSLFYLMLSSGAGIMGQQGMKDEVPFSFECLVNRCKPRNGLEVHGWAVHQLCTKGTLFTRGICTISSQNLSVTSQQRVAPNSLSGLNPFTLETCMA